MPEFTEVSQSLDWSSAVDVLSDLAKHQVCTPADNVGTHPDLTSRRNSCRYREGVFVECSFFGYSGALYSQWIATLRRCASQRNSQMPCLLISGAHEWINEIPTVPIYYLAKPQPRERAWNNQRGKKTLLSLPLVSFCRGAFLA